MRIAAARAAAVIAVLLAGALRAHAGDWSLDSVANCRIWNPHPQGHEAVRWSGACANGLAQGHGTAKWSLNSLPFETDEGEWSQGRQIGHGTQVWSTGLYDGELFDGEPSGHGVLVSQGARYEGEFRNGKPNGRGTLVNGNDTFRGIWTDGCLRRGERKVSFGVPVSACH